MVFYCMQCNIDYQPDGVFLEEAKKGIQTCCGECGCSLDVLIIPKFLRKNEKIHQLDSQQEASQINIFFGYIVPTVACY